MNEPIKAKIIFDTEEQIHPSKVDSQTIAAKQLFSQDDVEYFHMTTALESEPDEGQVEGIIHRVLKPKRSIWQKLVITGIGLFAISTVAQGIAWIHQAWQHQDWISLATLCAAGLIIAAGIGAIVTEWHHLYRLRARAEERDIAKVLLSSHGLDKGRAFCEKIARQAGIDSHHPALIRWQTSLHETHNDREVVELYAKLVQPVLDKQARADISRYAAESALMIAVSPLALVDMAFIAWRNIKLINQIARIYGIQLGYFSRLKLFRLVLVNIAFAGASELIRDVGLDWLSQDIAARLSTRAAQGIGAGLLTARLGIKAMELCRPLPWLENDKPKLTDFRKELITLLKKSLPNPAKTKGN